MNLKRPLVIFIMGVSGVGKSTIGKLLAKKLVIPFFDGDDYHSKENIAKMNSGNPLDDNDRYGWLETLNDLAKNKLQSSSCIIACSALKESYRDLLKKDIEAHVKFIFLRGDFDLIKQRLERREHFMPTSLLRSQFETLEEPLEAINTDISSSPEEIVNKLISELLEKTEFGIVGLGVMGTSIARNMASKGFQISIHNRHIEDLEEKVALKASKKFKELSGAQPYDDLKEFVNSLQKPRKILIMVNAGKAVDSVIERLTPLLTKNDVLIDGGNSHFEDTNKRISRLQKRGIHYLGAGISGGEDGALKGPSIMPSGNKEAYSLAKPFLEKIAAVDANGNSCCTYIGPEGSGHFIKTIHNGIEYVEMQLLAEVYLILTKIGKNPYKIADILTHWKSKANSFLLNITIDILRKKEGDDWLINEILDKSGNKGTGSWSTIAGAQLGVPSTMIASALFARYLSSFKKDRVEASKAYNIGKSDLKNVNVNNIFSAYQFARIINHLQGFQLIKEASKTYDWNVNLSEIARIWTNGCIIRSDLMESFTTFFKNSDNLLFDPNIKEQLLAHFGDAKQLVADCIQNEIPIPNLSDALNYFNGLKTAFSSANLIQAQRDYFGAHTYQRIDDPSGYFYHTDWKNSK